ncbi:MAG: hypothetical protein IT423_24670, partial [Pirellulaceae bacterium]|nr:hypothetical protein [Pirellulaceae bacterium]
LAPATIFFLQEPQVIDTPLYAGLNLSTIQALRRPRRALCPRILGKWAKTGELAHDQQGDKKESDR